MDHEENPNRYTNHYRHCGTAWSDNWSCMCNDRCPVCNKEIQPYESIDNNPEAVDDCAVYGNPNDAHLYQLTTNKGTIQVHANIRASAARIARECGYKVRDCNMIG